MWLKDVSLGTNDDYLTWLHTLYRSEILLSHWRELRQAAAKTVGKEAKGANKPKLIEIRARILAMPQPPVFDCPIVMPDSIKQVPPNQAEELKEMAQTIDSLNSNWNYHAKSNFRVTGCRTRDFESLEEFRRSADSSMLNDFLNWVRRCAENGFGLFLDY